MKMLKAILVVIERFSLTPALSRWERENGRQMAQTSADNL
jgi:hypothetical protein